MEIIIIFLISQYSITNNQQMEENISMVNKYWLNNNNATLRRYLAGRCEWWMSNLARWIDTGLAVD